MTEQDHGGPEGLREQFRASTPEIADLYDNWAETYDGDLDDWDYRLPDTIAAMLAEGGLPAGQIIDVGCGTGLSGLALRAVGAVDVLGTDLSAASLDVAMARGVYTATQIVDFTEPLPFENDHFAAAIAVGVFSYFGDPEPVLRELLRVVRPGGAIIFSQRTDLWEMFDCDAVVARLADDGLCAVEVSSPLPYLPKHPEFGDTIKVIVTTLTVT